MTTGQLIFYGGIVLLIITIILGIIFWIKKPHYIPENAAYDGDGDKHTRRLRNGYPTDRLTIRREPKPPLSQGTVPLQEDTARLKEKQTAPISDTEVLNETETKPGTMALDQQQTEKLAVGTAPPPDETAKLEQVEGTAPLSDSSASPDGATAVLEQMGQPGDTEQISGTTPLSGT